MEIALQSHQILEDAQEDGEQNTHAVTKNKLMHSLNKHKKQKDVVQYHQKVCVTFQTLLTICVACFSQNVATLCLLACAPDLGASFIKDGKLQYCPGYANALFSSCGGDTLYCANNTAPCLLDPESTEGCRKVSEDATNAEEFVTKVLGGAYVASGENCFNSAGRVSVAIAAVFVAVVAFFGLM